MVDDTINQPSEISVSDGCIFMDGPGGLAVTMTPEAGRITGERLIAAAARANAALQNSS